MEDVRWMMKDGRCKMDDERWNSSSAVSYFFVFSISEMK
jgi:hypothetical protein